MDVLKTVAPTVAAALGGPLAGLAVEAVSKVFGWKDATKEKVEAILAGPLSPEDVARVKVAEMELIKHERELGLRFAELEVKDRTAAHAEQQATIRNGDNAEDEYVRHTRPLVARQSWYGLVLYVVAFEGMKVYGKGDGASLELAMLIASPVLAYIGFRSMFDNFGLPQRVGGAFKRGK